METQPQRNRDFSTNNCLGCGKFSTFDWLSELYRSRWVWVYVATNVWCFTVYFSRESARKMMMQYKPRWLSEYSGNSHSHHPLSYQARMQDFGQDGPAEFWPKKGAALSPKFAQNRDFPLKIACRILKKSWGQGGPSPYCPPGSATAYLGWWTAFHLGLRCWVHYWQGVMGWLKPLDQQYGFIQTGDRLTPLPQDWGEFPPNLVGVV